jgi:alpha-tubulin suppressor-like RCC1 family protein
MMRFVRGAFLTVALVAVVVTSLAISTTSAWGLVRATTSSHNLLAWGRNDDGELGLGTISGPTQCSSVACATSPSPVNGIGDVTRVSAGYLFALALVRGGSVYSWGSNPFGQLGTLTSADSQCESGPPHIPCTPTPARIAALQHVKGIAAGNGFGLALLRNGTVETWGSNFGGELGRGSFASADTCVFSTPCDPSPAPVPGLTNVVAIAAGDTFAYALLGDGSVMAWGSGPLGSSQTSESDVPIRISSLSNVEAIAAGGSFALALLTNGTVMSWGSNQWGWLGDGDTSSLGSATPVTVSNLSNIKSIAAGGASGLAVSNSGSVYAWGLNDAGELGDGSAVGPAPCPGTVGPTCALTPVRVVGITKVKAVSAGFAFNMALTRNGSVFVWGSTRWGLLGNGAAEPTQMCSPGTPCSVEPVQVPGLTSARKISAAGYAAFAEF